MKDDRLYLIQDLESNERVESYTVEGRATFMADTKTQDAVVRNFEIMGEAAKRVSEKTRSQAPDVAWRRIAGFRDVLIHQYEGVDLNEVWAVVEQDLPGLKARIEAILHKQA